MRSIVVVALAAGAAGCGLDMAGLAAVDAGLDAAAGGDVHVASDGGAPTGTDASNDAGSTSTGDSSDGGSCVASLPAGWVLSLYESARAACPPGYGGSHDLVQGATAGPGACACSCQVTAPPACDNGTVTTQWASQPPIPGLGPCFNAGAALPVAGSGCTAFPSPTRLGAGFSGEPFQPSGGSCTASVNADPSKVTKNAVRTCDVPQPDAESVCSGAVPAGFSACIEIAGDVPCPAGPFQKRFAVGDDLELVCPACAICTVTGTCNGATVKFFSDQGCNTQVATYPCDGSCHDTGNANDAGVAAYEYTAQAQPGCQAPTSGGPTYTTVNPQTVCCR
jgi:hypothetical protein